MADITRESIIDAVKAAAADAGGPLSFAEFRRSSGLSEYTIYRFFPDRGWTEVLELAGIPRHPKNKDAISDEELIAEFHRVASDVGEIPTWARFRARAKISSSTIGKRFGGIQGTLKRYREWLEQNSPGSPLLAGLSVKSPPEVIRSPAQPVAETKKSNWAKLDGIEYGAPINFRGLRHAPINEQGVVYLFGMVSDELGLIVEAVQAGYPDCEAKRCVNSRENRWQRVRIEFEFRSRNFRDHGHDPSKCDLIVCWQHDWPECPLEVVELRTVIDRLEG